MNSDQVTDVFLPEARPQNPHTYGLVKAINDDGSYQVQLNKSSTLTRCANFCTAMVGDLVKVVINANGKCDAIGRLGGDAASAVLNDTMGTAHLLESSVTPGANYSSVSLGDAYLLGNCLRLAFSATRKEATSGNITNETVCTIAVKHGGRIKNAYNVSFTSGSSGGNASFTTGSMTNDGETLTVTVTLAAIAQSTAGTNAYFIVPVELDIDLAATGSTGGGGGGGGSCDCEGYAGVTPADYVVEWGNTDGWRWEKWASGWAVADYIGPSTAFTTSSTSGNTYYCDVGTVTFPFEFVEIPRITASWEPASVSCYVTLDRITTKSVFAYINRGNSGNTTGQLCVKVSGFWKTPSESGGTETISPTIEERFEGIESDIDLLKTNKVLWSGAKVMTADQTITLSEAISAQPHGIILVWSAYSSNTARNYYWEWCPVPKHHVAAHSGAGASFHMVANSYGVAAYKYLYISDTSIAGADGNANSGTDAYAGVNYTNSYFVLRYVIGF